MEIHVDYKVPFALADVYAAWVSSETVIAPATAMDIHPVVGGHYRLIMETEDFTGRNEGEFLKVEPERRIVYTWEWNGDGEVTEIDVTFSAVPDGTAITIVHTGFRNQQSVENHRSGWDSYIDGFTAFLAAQA